MNDPASKGHILLSLTGWDPSVWVQELAHAAPERPVTLAPDGKDDSRIEYAVVWKPEASVWRNCQT
jgi:glyoxylate/hydroxypyruvate reductase A